ncbi:ABC transporter ATP-binding protein [Paenibacillus sp. CGMCC 1.16610]|uniref:ABC transporter ATP-binding protein n=2 Tax=Paenibacillus TaxID=44249 RepID=A0ABU6D6T7_9BACL|nr:MULTISPECIES: ABC transporter ATP-binding protein [Paenibacillus]MBA2944116.1 ABC transporter ATP-binding protein [Paenibacillus sp. CGMCC 1.16610]MCY9661202.1 ABC transporter ATP-binding protein [Paenibacillus anseongense]MEB4793448.1 ABC transporter ATP-binding protein [Paenibacillus chondroitinus]MVQ38005.1 ATP-binding cassette domain-containing protein [Paenibacillus anseongense]
MIHCENLVKIYKAADLEVVALQGLDLHVEEGELMAIIGNSGSGKSTLLNMLGGLDRPSAGNLHVDGKDLLKFKEADLVKYKRETVGFVWQNNARNLIPYLTALENVELPILLQGRRKRHRALELLEAVGLSHRRSNKLNELSGGEQQRVAIAIALANQPRLLLADEPTGSVDTKMANQILDLFRELNRSFGLTVVIVTHDPLLAKKVDRVVAIRDGKTSSEILRRKSYQEELLELEQGILAAEEDSHVEYAVVDKAGRLQIPANFLDSIGASRTNKVRVAMEDGRIVLLPPDKT